MVYKCFDKKPASGSGVANNEINQNLQLAQVLHKPIIRNFKERAVYSEFKDIIDIFSKYAWVVPLKDKKVVSNVNEFQKMLNDAARKPNKIWIDKGGEFYNNSFKRWLKDNDIEM